MAIGIGLNRIDNVYPADEASLLECESELRSLIERGFRFLRFPARLEKLFAEHDNPRRRKRYLILGLISVLIYDFYCLSDMIVLRDIYQTAWLIRLGIVTPLMISFLLMIYFRKCVRMTEALIGAIVVLTSLSILIMLMLSADPNEIHYHTGIIIIIIFGNIVVVMRFATALVCSIIVQALYSTMLPVATTMPFEAVSNHSLVLATAIIMSLMGNYQMEAELRRVFLVSLLNRFESIKLARSNRALEELSVSDPLTGLYNRRYFDAALEREWRASQRSMETISLLYLDIDNFKPFNDTYGHTAGDRCLVLVAAIISSTVRRPYDVCARYGGEEFVVLLPKTDIGKAAAMAEKIRMEVASMRMPHQKSDIAPYVTISIGVAGGVPGSMSGPDSLVAVADNAMYAAKRDGRDRVRTAQK
jgi:diguanylate cyclase (GGDEF)-like protein